MAVTTAKGYEMDQRAPPILVGDAAGLDFLNSIATPVDAVVDWISDGAGLLHWLSHTSLVSVAVLADLRSRALPGELDGVAEQARRLREWFRGFVSDHKGRPLNALDLEQLKPLNRLLEREDGYSRISPGSAGSEATLELEFLRRWRSADALLAPIAQALAQLVVTENFENIRACEGPACTLMFADHTRGRHRRWCSMSICGNRAKQAAHRQRLSAAR
jgi:predicted RNA-binding Zn ribbon-like protein